MKKRLYFSVVLSLFLSALSLSAQTQSGYVRTAGRPDNKEGKAIPGVEIRFRGKHNAVVSNKKGIFNVELTSGETYYIINSVLREGYELQEKELLGRREPVSESVAKEIVMISLKEKRLIEEKVRKQVEDKYQKKLERLQRELNEKSISEERYRAEMQRLNDEYDLRDRLVRDMVERYVHSDYAHMSAKEAEINAYIENGELEKADSVINSLNIGRLEADRASLVQDISVKERQIVAEKSAIRSIDSTLWIAYRAKADIFYADFQSDSVLFYLEKLLSLDTTNVALMIEIGSHYDYYMADKVSSLKYHNRAKALLRGDSTSVFMTICMNDIGTCYYDYGVLDSMKIYMDEALRLARKQGDRMREALALSNLALYYDRIYDVDNEKRCIEQSMEIYVSLYGSENEHLIVLLNSLASMYMHVDDNRKAIQYAKKALGVMPLTKAIYDNVWPCYNSLGNAYENIGMLDSAEYWYNKAMDMVVKVYGSNHPNVATVIGNISALHNDRDRVSEAIEMRKRSLAINKAFYKDYNREIARDLVNLSTLYGKTGQFDSSLQCALKALRIYEVIDSMSPDLITLYSNIGSSYTSLGELQTALGYFIKGDNIAQKFPGVNKEGVSSLYLEIGNLFNTAGMSEKALAYYEESVSLLDEIHESDNHNYLAVLNNMSVVYRYMGNYEKCFELHRRINRILEKDGLDNTMTAARIYQTYATHLFEGNEADSAGYYLRKAYPIVIREYGDTSWQSMSMLSNLKEYYFGVGRYDSSLVYVRRVYDMYHRRQMFEDYDFFGLCLMINTNLHRLGRMDECAEFMEDKAFVLDVNPEGPMASRGYEGRYYLLEWKSWNFTDTMEFYSAHLAEVPIIKVVVYRDGKTYSESFEGKAGVNVHMALVGSERKEELTKAYNERK